MPESIKITDKQKTEPKTGKPVEIPVPKKADVQRDLLKVAKRDQSRGA